MPLPPGSSAYGHLTPQRYACQTRFHARCRAAHANYLVIHRLGSSRGAELGSTSVAAIVSLAFASSARQCLQIRAVLSTCSPQSGQFTCFTPDAASASASTFEVRAHMRAATQPIPLHPKRTLTAKIGVPFLWCRAPATSVGAMSELPDLCPFRYPRSPTTSDKSPQTLLFLAGHCVATQDDESQTDLSAKVAPSAGSTRILM